MAAQDIQDVYVFCRKPKNYKDFWELNNDLVYLDPFFEFSKDKNSGKIMTALYMIYDPKSQLENSEVSLQDKKKSVNKNFLKDENFDWKPYGKIIRAYRKYSKTKIEKAMENWYRDLEEREEFLREEMEWSESNAKDKDAMLLKTKEHFKEFNEIRKLLKEERHEALMHGNYTMSMLEARTALSK